MVADLYHSVVHYNCSKKQQKRIPSAVQTGSRSISQRSALKLQFQTSKIYSCGLPEQQHIYITAQCITIAVKNNTNVYLPPSIPTADLYHSAVHYNSSNKHQKHIPPNLQNGRKYYIMAQYNTIAVTGNRKVFLPPSRMEAHLYHSAVH